MIAWASHPPLPSAGTVAVDMPGAFSVVRQSIDIQAGETLDFTSRLRKTGAAVSGKQLRIHIQQP